MNYKTPTRLVFGNAVALIATSIILRGFHIDMNIQTIGTAAIILSLANVFIEPILNAISFPINVLTLGLFHLIINAVLLYITMLIVKGMYISADRIYIDFMGLVVPEISLSWFWMLIVTAIVIRAINIILKILVF